MNLTDQYLKSLIVLVRHSPNDKALTNEWFRVSFENAKRFANHLQKGKKHKKDPDIAAHDAVARVWENLFIKGYPIKKSATTVLYYQVLHSVGDRTKKDDEASYDAFLEDREEKEGKGIYEAVQGMQENDTGRFVLRGPQGNRDTGTSPSFRPPCKELSRKTRRTISKYSMEKVVPRYTQLTLDL